MGRKRLLTILAAVTAAVGVQVGTASAQTISLPGLGDITLEAGECLEVGVDISLADALKLDPSVCVSDDGVQIDGGVAAGDQKLDVGEATQPVEDATKKVADTAKGAGSKAPEPTKPSPEPEPTPTQPSEPSKGGDGGAPSSGSGGTSGGSSSPDVAASGDAEERSSDRDRDSVRQLGALRSIASDMAASAPSDIAGPVQPFGGLSSTDDLAAPQVADADGQVVPGVDERLTPQVAPAPDQQEAVLATSSPLRNIPEAPVALQLLAAALVLGAATVWTIASRELGTGTTSA